jgi:hypothetical protein
MSASIPPYVQAQPPARQNSSLAIASMILGILGWTFLPILGTIGAIITGHIAKSEIKNSHGSLSGDGMATAGLVLGYVQVVVGFCLCTLLLVFPAALGWLWQYGDSFIN